MRIYAILFHHEQLMPCVSNTTDLHLSHNYNVTLQKDLIRMAIINLFSKQISNTSVHSKIIEL